MNRKEAVGSGRDCRHPWISSAPIMVICDLGKLGRTSPPDFLFRSAKFRMREIQSGLGLLREVNEF